MEGGGGSEGTCDVACDVCVWVCDVCVWVCDVTCDTHLHGVVNPLQLHLPGLEMEAPALTMSKHCGKRVQKRQRQQGGGT